MSFCGLKIVQKHVLYLDPSIPRVRPKKIQVFRAEKIMPMTVPWDVGLSFRAGPGLGRAAHAFYSVK
jgi:hypothetical protein